MLAFSWVCSIRKQIIKGSDRLTMRTWLHQFLSPSPFLDESYQWRLISVVIGYDSNRACNPAEVYILYKFRHIAVAHSQTDECQNSRPLSSSSLKTHVKSAIVILPSLLLSFRIPILHFWLAPSHSSCATLDLFLPCLQKEDDIHDWRRVSSSRGSSKASINGIPYATNNLLAISYNVFSLQHLQ